MKNYLIATAGLQIFASLTMAFTPNANVMKMCTDTRSQMSQENLVVTDDLSVPLDYERPGQGSIKLFYWIKPGTDRNKPPLLLVHGGPGGNSWRYYSVFKTSTYTGDIVSIDLRNEGCSNVMDYFLPVENYKPFSSRAIVRDLETLRRHLYPNKKWRLFGQSRGAALTYYYLEMFPHSLESVQAHAVVGMFGAQEAKNYSSLRAQAGLQASAEFESRFPVAAQILKDSKDYLDRQKICFRVNLNQENLPVEKRYEFCGGAAVDAMGYKLTNFARWKDIASMLQPLRKENGDLDTDKLQAYFQQEVDGNIWVQNMNYILGTVGLDYANPTIAALQSLQKDESLGRSALSEMNFVAQVVLLAFQSQNPDYRDPRNQIDKINFKKIKKFLKQFKSLNGSDFPWTIYVGKFDSIENMDMRKSEQSIFGDSQKLILLENSGHEGWMTEPQVRENLER